MTFADFYRKCYIHQKVNYSQTSNIVVSKTIWNAAANTLAKNQDNSKLQKNTLPCGLHFANAFSLLFPLITTAKNFTSDTNKVPFQLPLLSMNLASVAVI